MSFKDVRFPPNISYNAVGGAGFSTNVVMTNGGSESRNQVWAYELSEWEVAHAARLPADWRPLQAFFRVMAGQAHTFRFKDWLDFTATAAEGLFVATAEADEWQMIKRYTFGAQTVDRKITKPISAVTLVGGGTVDYTTGIVTNATIPTSWAGQFDVHARFGTDKMRAETIDKSGGEFVVGWSSIPIIEVRE